MPRATKKTVNKPDKPSSSASSSGAQVTTENSEDVEENSGARPRRHCTVKRSVDPGTSNGTTDKTDNESDDDFEPPKSKKSSSSSGEASKKKPKPSTSAKASKAKSAPGESSAGSGSTNTDQDQDFNEDDDDFEPPKPKKSNAKSSKGKKNSDPKPSTSKSGTTSSPKPTSSTSARSQSSSSEPTTTTATNGTTSASTSSGVGERVSPFNMMAPGGSNRRPPLSNMSMIHSLFRGSVGGGVAPSAQDLERRSRNAVIDQVSQFRVFKSVTPFDRRVTAITWHPKEPTLCAVGSKGGDLLLWNYVNDDFQSLITGIGPGGSIQCLKFDTENSNRVYTCSIDGTFAVKDFGGKNTNVFLNTDNWDKWYTSFDVSNHSATLMAGDNNGFVTMLTKEGEMVWRARLHKSKVTNIQFSPREPWLVITTSTDNTVKVWDIRTLSNQSSTTSPPPSGSKKATSDERKNLWLHSLEHEKPVNSAYFNTLDGTRLLTTDQHSQLRVYRSPYWTLETTISHPHRQFQHLTPIRASWHPLVDIIVAGRYPDEKLTGYVPGELRSIDFIDPDSGDMLYQLHEPGVNKIVSLNQFSRSGDALLSGVGQSIFIWKQKPEDPEASPYQSIASSMDNLTVEQWPGFKPQPKKRPGLAKKLASLDDD